MSTSISSVLGIMPNLLYGVDRLSTQNDTLTSEETSGVVADDFAGLGEQTYDAISLEPQITANNAWQANLTQGQTKLSTTQAALSGIGSIASSLQSSLLGLTGDTTTTSVAAASSSAKQALTQLTSLLNTQNGNSYVFAGTALDQAPVNTSDLADSAMVSSIMSAVATVGTTGSAAAEASTLASASDNTPGTSVFSAQLSTSALAATSLVPQLQVGQSDVIANGIVATQGGAATAQSTGSPIRDLIRALATVAGLAGADTGSAAFTQLVSSTSSQMQDVSQGIEDLVTTVGATQASIAAQSSTLSDVSTALQSQFSTIMEADPATVRSQQVAVQNQLTASYTLIADMKTMTLAQYL